MVASIIVASKDGEITPQDWHYGHSPGKPKSGSMPTFGRGQIGRNAMKRYVIERNVNGIGGKDQKGLSAVAGQSNDALSKLRPRIQWQESFVTGDKTFCIYLAEDEAVIREHARLSGFPANIITEVKAVIDPATAA